MPSWRHTPTCEGLGNKRIPSTLQIAHLSVRARGDQYAVRSIDQRWNDILPKAVGSVLPFIEKCPSNSEQSAQKVPCFVYVLFRFIVCATKLPKHTSQNRPRGIKHTKYKKRSPSVAIVPHKDYTEAMTCRRSPLICSSNYTNFRRKVAQHVGNLRDGTTIEGPFFWNKPD